MVSVEISPEYGYVILVFVATIFLNFWLGINVGKARKKHEVPLPQMYSDRDQKFNCIQRAHQNMLESYPYVLVLLLLGGIKQPVIAAAAGSIWIVGRVLYALGYYTGDPAKRSRGAIGYIGLLALLGCTVHLALSLLGIA
ncbi:microsomal glutathione S-transferase 3 [Lingula anatina]|uniref:Glutathione S-transferase 3, mitochondrial n=1 Tax=Lingula anatina TaxID=7574 RepID=A0A1S3K208_LINAN|nr:microsomal glutathione S-transferase 3 [Lingula anatina]|eukprot:XP_013416665.1 microsomal glutathione S-transferase 3 [Lingula anatina]